MIEFFSFLNFIQIDDVRMLDRYNMKKPLIGTLYITATHTIFVEPETNKETWVIFAWYSTDYIILKYLLDPAYARR